MVVAVAPRRARASSAELMASAVWCGCEGGKARRGERGQSACGEQQGALLFKPASALRGQGEPSAWRTRGGHQLTSVGHELTDAGTL